MDFNGLNRCSFSLQSRYPDGKFCGIFSFTMCLREIRGICVRRGVRCGEDVGGFGNVGNCD